MNNESYYGAIRDQIFRMKEGSVVAMKDFESVATYDSIRKTLSRLCELKLIVRIVPGIYCVLLGADAVFPHPLEVIHALARNNDWTVVPGTERARYLLGLRGDEPETYEFFSSGPTSHHSYQGINIVFRHQGNKFLTSMSYKSALITSALWDLQNHKVTANEVALISNKLEEKEIQQLMTDCKYAPPRLRCVLEIICGDYGPQSPRKSE